MNAAANAYQAYRTAEIETISQRELIVKMYQGMERFIVQAQMAMHNKKLEAAHENCQKVKAILVELISTLNFEQGGDIAQQLRELYAFFLVTVVEANLRKDPAKLASILPIIAELRTAWEQIPDEYANTSSLPEGHEGHTLNLRT